MNQITPFDDTSPLRFGLDKKLDVKVGLFVAAVLCAPFLINAFHAMPSSDDFCYAAQTDKAGYLESIAHYYANVNGRFFATVLIVSLDWLFPIERAYAAVPLIFFGLIALAFVALFRGLVPKTSDWRLAVVLGLMASLVLVANAGALAEVFYWLSASATYLSATALMLFALAAMIVLLRHDLDGTRHWLVPAGGAAAAMAASGSAEIVGPAIIASGATCVLIARLLHRPAMAGIALIAAGAALGLWLNLSSPGTATRAEVIAVDTSREFIDLIVIVLRSILWTSEYLANWATRTNLWIFALTLFLSLGGETPTEWYRDRHRRVAVIAACLCLFALPYLAAFPMFYAYGVPHPQRAHIVLDALCMLFWLAVLTLAFAAVRRAVTFRSFQMSRRHVSLALFAAFFTTVAGTWNFHHASLDTLRGIAFASEAAAQIGDVAGNPNRAHQIVTARQRSAYAPTLQVSDITPDPRRWRNVCFAEFLGAQGVRARAGSEDEDFEFMPEGWIDPDPQAIGRPRPPWPEVQSGT